MSDCGLGFVAAVASCAALAAGCIAFAAWLGRRTDRVVKLGQGP